MTNDQLAPLRRGDYDLAMLVSWVILTVAFLVAAAVVPGFKIKGGFSAFVIAALFGVLNFFLGHLLFVVIGFATLGVGFLLAFITRLVVSAVVLKVTDAVTDRLTIDGFAPAVFGALIISCVGSVGDWLAHPVGRHFWR